MKPSVEAKHVLGEKKPRPPVIVAKRIGRAVFGEAFLTFANRYQRSEVYDEREAEIRHAEAETLAKNKKFMQLKEVRKAVKKANGGIVQLKAELPTATIEAGFKTVDPARITYLDHYQDWELQVTTKGNKPITSLFVFQERTLHDNIYYDVTGSEAYVGRCDPATGESIYYFNEAEKTAMAQTVGRCFDELRLAGEKGQLALSVQPPRPEQVAA